MANLHGQITSLENELLEQESQKYRSIVMLTAAFILLLAGVYFFVVKRYIRRVSTDTLTGLLNERAVITLMRRLPQAQTSRTNALAVIEISHIRRITAKYGHIAAERALQAASVSLRKVTREEDIIGRLGNDQFVVCLRNIDESLALESFERVQNALDDTQFISRASQQESIESQLSVYLSTEGLSDIDDVLADMRGSFTNEDA